jgi:RNA polymerase sigma-70 factor, ECF subfamily
VQHGEPIRPDAGPALLELYDGALPQVYGYLLARCGRRALAEDLTAETFLAAVAACRRTPPPRPSTGWLVGIARHKLVDHWRAAEREERGLRAVADSHPRPDHRPGATDDPWDERLDALLAREVLAALSIPHRAALTLRYLDGLPVPEVARTLGRTVAATEALLTRARTAFRRRYPARPPDALPTDRPEDGPR